MSLELIAFIASILFGILWYWQESNSNKVYRFVNKLLNAKELQMKATNKKGFVYQQTFLLRLVFITAFFLVVILISQILIPISIATVSLFTSMIFGTLVGTYIANLVFKSTKIITEKSDSLEETINETIEKGKDFIDDVLPKEEKISEEKVEKKEEPKNEKSARERLKDKGLL